MVRAMTVLHHISRHSFRRCLLLSIALLPIGCSSVSMNPIAWMHDAEGGDIASERPPVPQADAPYPNLASVPERPAPADPHVRAQIAQGLVADRANAQYALTSEPPAPTGVRPLTAIKPDESAGARMQTAAASPRPVRPSPAPAPTPSTDTAAKPDAAVSGAQKVLQPMREARAAEPVATLPPVAAAPPAAARVGQRPTTPSPAEAPPAAPIAAPTAVAPAPAPAPIAAPATQPVPPSQVSGKTLRIGFAPGSDTLPGDALAALKLFAHERGARSMVITGFGDSTDSDAKAQSAALPLALARARAVASYLMAAGVPPASVRVGAQAQGQGAAVRLAD